MTAEERAHELVARLRARQAERKVLRSASAVVDAAAPALDPISRLGAIAWQLIAFLVLAGAAAGLVLAVVVVLVTRRAT